MRAGTRPRRPAAPGAGQRPHVGVPAGPARLGRRPASARSPGPGGTSSPTCAPPARGPRWWPGWPSSWCSPSGAGSCSPTASRPSGTSPPSPTHPSTLLHRVGERLPRRRARVRDADPDAARRCRRARLPVLRGHGPAAHGARPRRPAARRPRACGAWPGRSAPAGPASSALVVYACMPGRLQRHGRRGAGPAWCIYGLAPWMVNQLLKGSGLAPVRVGRRRSRAGRDRPPARPADPAARASSPPWPPWWCPFAPSSWSPGMALAFVIGGLLVGEVRGAGRLLGVGLGRRAQRRLVLHLPWSVAPASPAAGRRSWA